MKKTQDKESLKVRINCTIRGEPAAVLLELKKRGIFSSNREAIVRGLEVFYQQLLEGDLKKARLAALQKIE